MSEVGEFFSRKEYKVRKGLRTTEPETRNQKLTKGKTFYSPWQKSTVEKRSRVILQVTAVILICKFRTYHYRRKNDIILTLFDGEIMSLDESEGNFMATSSITANFYCDDAKAANAFVRMLVRPAGCVKSDSNVAHAHKFETEKESKAFYMKTLATARKVLSGRSRSSCRRNAK